MANRGKGLNQIWEKYRLWSKKKWYLPALLCLLRLPKPMRPILPGLSLIGWDELANRSLPAADAHAILIRQAIMEVKLVVFMVWNRTSNKENKPRFFFFFKQWNVYFFANCTSITLRHHFFLRCPRLVPLVWIFLLKNKVDMFSTTVIFLLLKSWITCTSSTTVTLLIKIPPSHPSKSHLNNCYCNWCPFSKA